MIQRIYHNNNNLKSILKNIYLPMTQSQIQAESNLYMALMDLKNDIVSIKNQLHHHDKQISKTYRETCDKFEQVVKLSTNTFTEVANQNSLIQKQNQIHIQLTKSNEKLAQDVRLENARLNQIFEQQRCTVEKVLQANQVIVNEELTAICKKQEQMIQQQIDEYNTQNKLLEQQRQKIELSLQSVANFESRNNQLEKLLLQQKQQLQPYIAYVTQQNKQLVMDLIYKKQAEFQQRQRVVLINIQTLKAEADRTWQGYSRNMNEVVRKADNDFGAIRNKIEGMKNETVGYKNQASAIKNEQKNMFDATKQQFQRIQQIKRNIHRKMDQVQQKSRRLQKDISPLRQSISNIESKLRNHDQHQRQEEEKFRKVFRTLDDNKRENRKQTEDMLGEMRNKVSQLDRSLNILSSKVDDLAKK